MTDLRARLRAVPTLTGSAPPFDPEAAPAEPQALFIDWLLAAVEPRWPSPAPPPCRRSAGPAGAEPELVASGWTLYTLRADEV